MRCKICGGGGGGEGEGVCDRHAEAERRLREHFKVWTERTGLGWAEYLEAILKNERTGILVKEAASYLLQNGR
ncbi:MAG: hypothetical protein ACQXXL_05075 [Candidatus Methanosuratincola sp.]|jgi:hypothetical protein|nr:hypothetical protein [Candidatus Methanosuratincola sp.]